MDSVLSVMVLKLKIVKNAGKVNILIPIMNAIIVIKIASYVTKRDANHA